jgi:hypothetical protein
LLMALGAGLAGLQPTGSSARQPSCQTFPETGKTVCGALLAYWREHGGLAQQGFPISSEFVELSEIDGKSYRVQYFERAVFELHPENQPPYDVLLSLLGSTLYRQKYPGGAPGQQPDKSEGSVHFPQTGKRLGGKFLDYWRTHGGLPQQGYPISDPFTEVSDLNGRTYTVQYFERAVFELHPENQPPYDVLLSQLGAFQLKRRYPNGEPGGPQPTPQGDDWADLRQRPLKLPAVAPGGACPTATGRAVSPDFGPAAGNGPVYAVGLGSGGVYDYSSTIEEGGWYYLKVLWVGSPSFKGPVLVRGRQVDGPAEMRFERGADPPKELRLHTDQAGTSASRWTNWPTYTRLRAPGCYAYQVDAPGFSEVIVFKAVNGQ